MNKKKMRKFMNEFIKFNKEWQNGEYMSDGYHYYKEEFVLELFKIYKKLEKEMVK